MDFKDIITGAVISILILIVISLAVFNVIVARYMSGFSELFFVGDLPKEIEVNKEYKFAFGIRNLENKETAYNYVVNIQPDKTKEGYIILNHSQATTIQPRFVVDTKAESPLPISVQLLNRDQEIRFWVDVK